jgi:hypothetical protein
MARVVTVILIVLQTGVAASAQSRVRTRVSGLASITIRTAALAQVVDEIAGYSVNVPGARIVWVIDSHALVIESAGRLESFRGNRDRVLVLLGAGRSLIVPRMPVMTSPVTILGIARTLLGVQVAHDVPWPMPLNVKLIDRLEIRAAVVATSVQTADGIELTSSETTIDLP